MALKEALPETNNVTERSSLYQHLLHLADKVLEGFTAQLDSIKQACAGSGENKVTAEAKYKQLLTLYEQHRSALVRPLCEY